MTFEAKAGIERPDRRGGFTTTGEITAPARLNKEGQAMWDMLLANLPAGIAQSVDAHAMYALCRSWEVYRYWDKKATSRDEAKAYKANCMIGNAFKNFLTCCKEFGLTPRSRQSIKYNAEANGTDDLSQFFEGQLRLRANLNN